MKIRAIIILITFGLLGFNSIAAKKAPKEKILVEKEVISILTDKEKNKLQEKIMSAVKGCAKVYQDIQSNHSRSDSIEGGNLLTEEERKLMVNQIGDMGFVSVSDNINMTNYKEVIRFYDAYTVLKEAQVTIFDIQNGGNIAALTFTYKAGRIQTYYVGIEWSDTGIPQINRTSDNDVAEMKLTEKSYFIYTNKKIIAHGNLREYYRVKPLSDTCRELTNKYVAGLSYVNYNMLITNWNSNNIEEILMPCMFEDIYRICTKERLIIENGIIPAETYEQIMTVCFPVTAGQLRQHCNYNKSSNSYEYEMIFASQFPPFPEVVDYLENKDGSITLFVDSVWPDYNSDYAFTNQIVVEPHKDGTFRYLSNVIEGKELTIPTVGCKGQL